MEQNHHTKRRENGANSAAQAKIIEFLTKLFQLGLSYSPINSVRRALSDSALCQTTNHTIPLGEHPLVKRFMKGIYELRSTFSFCKSIWDVNIVFKQLRKQTAIQELTLKVLKFQFTIILSC